MGDLISRKALLNEICKNGKYHGLSSAHRWNALRIVALIPAVDAVPRDEHEALLRRFRHLLQSDFIRSFDEVDQKTGKYKRDIAEADRAKAVRHKKWVHLGGDEWCCTGCGEVIHTEGSWEKPTKKYCNECGAKMDGGKDNA